MALSVGSYNKYGYICTIIGTDMDEHSYNIIKIKAQNGVTYVYEDYSYWDPEKRDSTHKRRSIGKVGEDGEIVYNKAYREREAQKSMPVVLDNPPYQTPGSDTKEPSPKSEVPLGEAPVSYTVLAGQKMILDHVCDETGVESSLKDAFSAVTVSSILALAYYVVCQGKAFSRSEPWLESRGYADLGLTSQRISDLLASITDDKVNTFFNSWIARQEKGDRMLFDITSISTYGKNNIYAERGYNRDHENLEQINLSLLTSVQSHLPMWYCMTPGSMSDVAVLEYVLKMLAKLNIKKFTFCVDRGFYSDFNLKLITKKGHRFMVPVPSTVGWQKKMIKENKGSMLHPDNIIELEDGSIIYGKTIYKVTEYGRTWYHVYYDPTRKEKVINDFMQRLRCCKDELEDGREFEKNKSIYEKYFIVKETPKRGRTVEYNSQAIQDFIDNDSCYWILMTNAEKDVYKALFSYRNRNDVEVCFDDVKNSADMKRLRNHSEATIKGKIFIIFIALVLLTQLRNDIQKIKPKDRHYWSEREFLDRVANYTKVHFFNRYKDVFTVPTKMQRDIFDMMGLEYSYKGKKHNAIEAKAPETAGGTESAPSTDITPPTGEGN